MSEMLRRGGICAPERCAHHCACGRGTSTGSEEIRDHTSGRYKITATRTAQRARGITCDSGGGLQPRGHDEPLSAKGSVQGKQTLDMADAEGGPEDNGAGRLRSMH